MNGTLIRYTEEVCECSEALKDYNILQFAQTHPMQTLLFVLSCVIIYWFIKLVLEDIVGCN